MHFLDSIQKTYNYKIFSTESDTDRIKLKTKATGPSRKCPAQECPG